MVGNEVQLASGALLVPVHTGKGFSVTKTCKSTDTGNETNHEDSKMTGNG